VESHGRIAESRKVVDGLVGFFDLLAQYDFEDQKIMSGSVPDSSALAPGEPGMGSDKEWSYGTKTQD